MDKYCIEYVVQKVEFQHPLMFKLIDESPTLSLPELKSVKDDTQGFK
jgi:hypothetical protein